MNPDGGPRVTLYSGSVWANLTFGQWNCSCLQSRMCQKVNCIRRLDRKARNRFSRKARLPKQPNRPRSAILTGICRPQLFSSQWPPGHVEQWSALRLMSPPYKSYHGPGVTGVNRSGSRLMMCPTNNHMDQPVARSNCQKSNDNRMGSRIARTSGHSGWRG